MKNNLSQLFNRLATVILISMPYLAFGNPVGFDPERGMSQISFLVVAAVCFTVEVIITASLFKLFHDIDKSLFLIGMLYLMNLIAFFMVLLPLVKFTKSIIVGEVGVLLAEMAGLRFCLLLSGSDTTWRRVLVYSLISNSLSIVISLGLK